MSWIYPEIRVCYLITSNITLIVKSILYCEDQDDTAAAVRILLEGAGFVVDTVKRGSLCVSRAQEAPYDMILLDLSLPDISGVELFYDLKQKCKARYALTSIFPLPEKFIDRLRQDGLKGYIQKPFKKDELIAKVRDILR
jgi:DNA-binding response OmpR family regulator